jgi:hypothetical protein
MWGVRLVWLRPRAKLQHVGGVIEARLRRGQHRYLVGDPVESSLRDPESAVSNSKSAEEPGNNSCATRTLAESTAQTLGVCPQLEIDADAIAVAPSGYC